MSIHSRLRKKLEELSKHFSEKKKKRDPARIKPMLELIEKVWVENPDLRLCQLIGNCFPAGDNYYREDSLLLEKLKEKYGVKNESIL